MTKKRFLKLAMSEGMTRDEAYMAAKCSMINWNSYQEAYNSMHGLLRGRFECYMPGHEKIVAKRNKRYMSRRSCRF